MSDDHRNGGDDSDTGSGADVRTLRTAEMLARRGFVATADIPALERVAARYAVAVTPAMASLISGPHGDDPIARQFIPDERELTVTAEERRDPIGDDAHVPVKGIVHRYPDRVLLRLLHTCPVYCRFCFRRESVGPGGAGTLTREEAEAALDYIAADTRILEVVLTGGDPFMLSPRRIAEVTARLAAIPHVEVVRWHTRVPVVAPERVTDELTRALYAGGKAIYVALHVNHARELAPPACAAIGRLADAGIVLLGQTVLLKGVNADPEILGALMRRLVALRVKPYYLHHPDLAPGTSHFRLSIEEGQAIVAALRGRLSGLAQPTYVLDIPGGYGKFPIGPSYLAPSPGGDVATGRAAPATFEVRDPFGGRHVYPPRE